MVNHRLKSSFKFIVPLFLALFFLSLFSSKTQRAPWYEQWGLNATSPVVSIFSFIKNKGRFVWSHYFFLVGVARENETLRRELSRLIDKQIVFEELAKENERLAKLLDLKETRWKEAIAAKVIAFDPRSEFLSVHINKGALDGVRPDLPVVTNEGLVGRVGPVFKKESIVLLIVDPASFIDVFVERSNFRCLLRGSGFFRHAELKHGFFLTHLEYLKKISDIQEKDVLLTSGLDQIFPKGIVIGSVVSIGKDVQGLFLKADVLPSVDFAKLTEVLVLK